MKKWLFFLLPAALLVCVLLLRPVYFPSRQTGGLPPLSLQPATFRPVAETPLDLNTATPEELQALPEIGPARAQSIVDYRTRYGPFRTVDELAAVDGIGTALLETVREFVTVGE